MSQILPKFAIWLIAGATQLPAPSLLLPGNRVASSVSIYNL